jgi:hypothetical protein
MPGETHFFDDIYSRRKELGDPKDLKCQEVIIKRISTLYKRYNEPEDQQRIDKLFATPGVLQELRQSCASYQDLLSFFMMLQMQHVGKSRWGNNVPKDIFHIEEILCFYPNAKFLICVRDARDFLVSYRNKWRTAAREENAQRLKNIYHPIITSFLWKVNVQRISAAEKIIPRDNFFVVQYENLVNNPENIVRSICTLLEENYEDAMIRIDTSNSSFETKEQGIFSSSVGRWRKILSREEAYIVQKINKDEMKNLGYSLENIEANPFQICRILVSLPYALWHALEANRDHRGPLVPYLARRLFSLLP